MTPRPHIFVVAGPEGAGKTTYTEEHLTRGPVSSNRLVISADRAQQQAGSGTSKEAYESGQVVAHLQAKGAIAKGSSFVYETTFSKDRDLQLLSEAKANGYSVSLIHLQTNSAELSVARVAERVREGGRDAPAEVVAKDYAAAPKLIAQASTIADRTYVMDSSALNQAPRHVMTLERGRLQSEGNYRPQWAESLYAKQLNDGRTNRMTAAERSFADAIDKAQQLAPGSTVKIAGRDAGEFTGPVVHARHHHVLQQTGPNEFAAHFKDKLAVVPHDQNVTFRYSEGQDKASVVFNAADGKAVSAEQGQRDAKDFLTGSKALKPSPRVAAAEGAANALEDVAATFGLRTDAVEKNVGQTIRASIAAKLHAGKPIEVTPSMVDGVKYEVAKGNLQSITNDKLLHPERVIRLEPEHRDVLVRRADDIAKLSQANPAPAYAAALREAEKSAESLARLEGTKGQAPYQSQALKAAYEKTQIEQSQGLQQQKSAGRER